MGSPDKENREINEQELERGALEALLGFQLRRAQIKLFQHFNASMATQAITPGHSGVLMLIESNPGISQAALARALQIERATLGETIDKLQKKQWVERRKSPSDGRSYALYLSSKGKKMILKLHVAIDAHERDVSDRLTTKERNKLLRLLTKFNAC